MNSNEADKQSVSQAENIKVTQGDNSIIMAFEIDDGIADGCIYLAAGIQETLSLGAAFSNVTVEAKS